MNILRFGAPVRRAAFAAPQHGAVDPCRPVLPRGWIYLMAGLISGPLWWGLIRLMLSPF